MNDSEIQKKTTERQQEVFMDKQEAPDNSQQSRAVSKLSPLKYYVPSPILHNTAIEP